MDTENLNAVRALAEQTDARARASATAARRLSLKRAFFSKLLDNARQQRGAKNREKQTG